MTRPDKQSLRTLCKARRAAMDEAARAKSARAFAKHFLVNVNTAGKTVAGYAPLKDELDVLPLLAQLDASGQRCCLPVTSPGSRVLRFYRWHPEAVMHPGAFGIHAPDTQTGTPCQPDIIIVPLVGFDAQCHRIGYGAGYYDATLASLRKGGRNVLAVGAAFACQQVEAIPTESHDEALGMILTEKGVIKKP